jgi:hypothetical protein
LNPVGVTSDITTELPVEKPWLEVVTTVVVVPFPTTDEVTLFSPNSKKKPLGGLDHEF